MSETINNKSRRKFLKSTSAITSGLLISFYLPMRSNNVNAGKKFYSPNAWIQIGTDNSVTVMCARAEMGQDVYTSMTLLIAEELEYDINKIKVVFAPPAEVFNNDHFGAQLTGGSTSVREAWGKLRNAGATAKMMLISAASKKWNVKPEDCYASEGIVYGPKNRKETYGTLADNAAQMDVPKKVLLKDKKQWKYIGKSNLKRLDSVSKIDGTAQFGIDTRVPGMLYATVQMPPMFGGKITSYDDSKAKHSPGVKAIVQITSGIAVVAESYWSAKKGRDLLNVNYDKGPNSNLDTTQLWSDLENSSKKEGAVFRSSGDVDNKISELESVDSKKNKILSSEYKLPFLSHSPLEPMNAMVDIRSDSATVVTGAQFPQILPYVVGEVSGVKPENIEVITTFLGGSFGRRGGTDYVIAAAEISKAVKAPVNLIWSREDDMMHDTYRPAGIMKLDAGFDNNGKISAFKFQSTSPSISAVQWPDIVKDGIDPFAVEGIDNYPYDTKNIKLAYQMHPTPITPGYWRSVSHTLNVVALECFIDECAKEVGQDPIDFRLSQLDMGSTKHQWSGLSAGVPVGSRIKRVLEEVRKKSNWGKKMPKGSGQGVAVMEGYNTVMAMVAEVSVDKNKEVILEKVTTVVDAGVLVHPDQALAQVEGSINYGQTAALFGEITLKNGIIEQDNFDKYRMVRINEAPKVMDTHFIDHDGSFVGGLGEPGTALIQPAIGNAIFAACGKRCRTMPFTPENINSA